MDPGVGNAQPRSLGYEPSKLSSTLSRSIRFHDLQQTALRTVAR